MLANDNMLWTWCKKVKYVSKVYLGIGGRQEGEGKDQSEGRPAAQVGEEAPEPEAAIVLKASMTSAHRKHRKAA